MNILEIFKLSIDNLLNFKLRSFLTMLGIIIGIASVVLISSIGAGFQKKILSDITTSLDPLVQVSFNPKYSAQKKVEKQYFSNDDIENISKLNYIACAAGDATFQDVAEEETTKAYVYFDLANKNTNKVLMPNIISGRYFNDEEIANGNDVVIIDRLFAEKQYGDINKAIGKKITFLMYNQKYTFIIIGVEKTIDESARSFSSDLTLKAMIPEKYVYKNFYSEDNGTYQTLLVKTTNKKDIAKATNSLKQYLKIKTGKDDLYKIVPLKEEIKQVTSVLDKISIFIVFIASISIAVGGIGVMNIMLVSVKERIMEIGLRKAIGAKNKQIIIQFLIETVVLTLIGGIIGIIFGYILAIIIGIPLKVFPILQIKTIIISFVVSSATGIIFGIYPAKQAANLSPMEALRKE